MYLRRKHLMHDFSTQFRWVGGSSDPHTPYSARFTKTDMQHSKELIFESQQVVFTGQLNFLNFFLVDEISLSTPED